MLRLAYENGKLLRLPVIRNLAVRCHLRPDLQVAIAIEYAFGWRNQSEVLTLERRQYDEKAGTLRLEPGTTKNDEGRLVSLPPDSQVDRVRALERQLRRVIPYLFPHLRGRHRGKRIRDFRTAWATACRKAGIAGRLRHDFRRTAVRNMVNRGIAERVAMEGHGAQDARRVRPLPHRVARRPQGGRPEAGGHAGAGGD